LAGLEGLGRKALRKKLGLGLFRKNLISKRQILLGWLNGLGGILFQKIPICHFWLFKRVPGYYNWVSQETRLRHLTSIYWYLQFGIGKIGFYWRDL